MFLHVQTQIFHHKKQEAQQALNENLLQQAVELYTEALNITQLLPHLYQEVPKVLSNRSLVFYRQKKFHQALEDANLCVQLSPVWIKVTFKHVCYLCIIKSLQSEKRYIIWG